MEKSNPKKSWTVIRFCLVDEQISFELIEIFDCSLRLVTKAYRCQKVVNLFFIFDEEYHSWLWIFSSIVTWFLPISCWNLEKMAPWFAIKNLLFQYFLSQTVSSEMTCKRQRKKINSMHGSEWEPAIIYFVFWLIKETWRNVTTCQSNGFFVRRYSLYLLFNVCSRRTKLWPSERFEWVWTIPSQAKTN